MTEKTKLEVRQREVRTRLSELTQIEDLTDENREEMKRLSRESIDNDTKLNALAVSESEKRETLETGEDSESVEFRELMKKAQVSSYIGAALEMRSVSGPEAELNNALKIGADRFPLMLLAPSPEEFRTKTDAESTVRPRRWIDRLFAMTQARALGITFESVGSGVSSHPVTTAGASAAQRGREEAATDSAYTVGVTELKPSRNTAKFTFNIEDAARLPGLEDALVRDLRSALTEGIDRAVFVGDSGANEDTADITGLQTATGVVEKTITQANKVKAPQTLEAFVELVDGKHAESLSDLSVVSTIGANSLWLTTLANSAVSNETVANFLRDAGISWRVRGGIETATTNGKFGAFIGLQRGIAGAGVAAIWESGSLIRDMYSGAAKGQVSLTLHHLWGFGFPRASNFARMKFVS